jgi:hypothetical protein
MVLPPRPNAPRDAFAVESLARLPLAESFYLVWAYFATDAALDALFEQHRGRCYQDRLRFTDLVRVLTDALTRYHGSGRRAITRALEREQLPTRQRAVYGKLARLPLPLAEALRAGLTARLRPLFPAGLSRTTLPDCLAGLAVVVIDGKKIKRAAKRLLATRGRPGKLYGGKVLAAYLPAEGLVVALAADPDGEANDVRLVPRALPLARAAVAGPRLWVADRQFCDLDQPGRFTGGGDHFLLRFAGKPAADPRRRYVRRITLERPGAEAIVLVTDLLDADACPAADLLPVYLARWQIGNVFQAITEVFSLRHLIGCAPQATVFQASLCLVIYNVLQVIRASAARAAPAPTPVAALSAEQIFTDLHEELIGLHRPLDLDEWSRCLPVAATAEQVQAHLRARLTRAWSATWRKAVNPKPRPYRPHATQSGAHTSVHKVLQAARANRDQKPMTPTPSG